MQSDKIRAQITRLLKWADVHSRHIVVGLVLVALCGGGWWYFKVYRLSRLQEASNLLYKAQEFHDAQMEQVKVELKGDTQAKLPQTFLDLEKRFLDVIQGYPSSAQAQIAALDLSKAYAELNRVAQAKEVLDMVRFDLPFKPLYYMRKALLAETLAEYEDSKLMWRHVLSDQQYGKSFHGVAKVHLARVEYVTNNAAAGKQLLDEVSKDYEGKFEAVEAEKIRLYYE